MNYIFLCFFLHEIKLDADLIIILLKRIKIHFYKEN